MGPADRRGFEMLGLAAEVRDMDAHTIEAGVPGRVLMELAGAGTARLIMDRTGGRPGRAVVLCGAGNNGGDGYVVARHLMNHGWTARCASFVPLEKLKGDAEANHAVFAELGGEVRALDGRLTAEVETWLDHADVIVDALLGTGLDRPVEGLPREMIEAANDRPAPLKVAVDIPSGVTADRGAILGLGFEADLTATYGISKPGLHQHPGAGRAGEVHVVDIGFPRAVVEEVGASWRLAGEEAVAGLLPPRPAASHKGTFGHVGVIAGLEGKEGAAVLASLGALRGGAGLVTWNRPGSPAGLARPPEVMTHDTAAGLDPRSDVLVVGPGMGTGDDARRLLDLARKSGRRLVLDADALNLLAEDGEWSVPEGAILTPHPAEAARLLGLATPDVQNDRPAAARRVAEGARGTVILKGAGTLVATHDRPGVVVPVAEPTLATGGTGDVLTGLLGALLGQGLSPHDAAIVGAFVHGRAGAAAGAGRGHQGVLASEVAETIPTVVDALRKGWIAD
ncbi:MAG: NAD(P)H-hydrate dehydratase [Myxococcota bacterium]